MNIVQAKFVTSVADHKLCRDYGIAEIAVAGKSNVGKSSVINMLCNMHRLAKTSSTPGRTRLINYFSVNNDAYMLVDLPGYGFAKVSDAEKEKWATLIEGYLQNSKQLRCVLVLVDIRHEPSALDRQMVAYLHHYGLPFLVVATKSDKLSRAQQEKQRNILAKSLALGKDNIILTSAQTKQGREELMAAIGRFVSNNITIE